MYSTKEAISMLLNNPRGLTLCMTSNPNIHIFKDVEGYICKGEYGDGSIIAIEESYCPSSTWKIAND